MQKSVDHPVYGRILYDENIWTGAKTLSINGTPLSRQGKKTFFLPYSENGALITVEGSAMTGVMLHIGNEKICIYAKPAWYEWILAALPLMLNLVWGNSVQLCTIIPVVGGAIGGAINGVALALLMTVMHDKPVAVKLLMALLGTAVAFAACAALALLLFA